jgi:formiminoglutamase
MSFDTHYQAPQKNLWQGRLDSPPASSFFQIIKFLDLTQPIPAVTEPLTFALLGFSCDEGIRRNLGRTGAADGPDTLRPILAKLPVHRKQAIVFDAGNITCRDHDLESAQQALGEAVHQLLQHGYIPIIVGGGHEMAWGHYQGIAKKYPQENLGIINVDTHFDMRPTLESNKGSSGTPFLQIAKAHEDAKRRFDYNCIGIQEYGNTSQLFKTAMHYNAHILLANDIQSNNSNDTEKFIKRIINDNNLIYLSLCLDVFSAAYAPGVSAPQAFGLSPWQVIPLIRQTAESGKVISYDIAELSPKYDIDSRTTKLTANFIYEIIHHHQHHIANDR